jgi:Transposase DDE domain
VLASANTEQSVDRVLADAGCRSESNFNELENAGINGYVPIGRKNGSAVVADDSPATQRMQRKLRTKRGRSRYRKRKHLAEPPFGWVKNVLGFRDFSLRGMIKVQGEWNLVCLALNLRRMQVMGT